MSVNNINSSVQNQHPQIIVQATNKTAVTETTSNKSSSTTAARDTVSMAGLYALHGQERAVVTSKNGRSIPEINGVEVGACASGPRPPRLKRQAVQPLLPFR